MKLFGWVDIRRFWFLNDKRAKFTIQISGIALTKRYAIGIIKQVRK